MDLQTETTKIEGTTPVQSASLSPMEKEAETIPRGTTGYVPMRITRQFAAFMFGYMALSGSLTKQQMEDSEEIEWIMDDLEKGIDEAVRQWTYGKFANLQDMYNAADWKLDDFRERHPKPVLQKDGAS